MLLPSGLSIGGALQGTAEPPDEAIATGTITLEQARSAPRSRAILRLQMAYRAVMLTRVVIYLRFINF